MLDTKTKPASFKENWQFIEVHRDELMEKYPEHWIAVVDREVVAADPDPWGLVDKMRKMRPFSDPGSVVVELLTSEEIYCIHTF